MAEIVGSAVVDKLVEYFVDPIKKQVSYLCCYSCNVIELGDELSKLEIDKKTLDERIERAREECGVIRLPADVDDWLAKVKDIQENSNEIRNEVEQIQQGCLSKWIPLLHYSLSKRARKTTEAAAERRNPTFATIAYSASAAEIEPIPVDTERLESRVSLENQIMDCLKNSLKKNDVYLIGIHGMGGIGKTTMVDHIETRAGEKTQDSGKMFEWVVKSVVSREANPSRIQDDIAEGLRLKLEEKSPSYRARRLHAALKEKQSVLIILDDVWDRLDLDDIGIPSKSTHPGCKLILASRDRNALTSTVQDAMIFQLDVLTEQESRVLFKKHAGDLIDSTADFNQIAEAVLEECGRLPLAIVTVGCALRGRGEASWKNALVGLRQSTPENIPGVPRNLYGPLLLSFDLLDSWESRYLFLLCCLFPEDSKISLEVLVSYGMGLEVFEGIENLAGARNRVASIVEDLIFRSLLIESSCIRRNPCVKMHDVIRDMGIWIAPKWKHVFMIRHGEEEWPMLNEDSYKNYTAISLKFSKGDVDVRECIDCPRLQLLRMDCESGCLNLPDNIFNGMGDLQILEALRLKTLPPLTDKLNHLRTLRLDRCRLVMISAIGKLMNLEILWLEHCSFIDEVLPNDWRKLKKLRKLDVFFSDNLKRIEYGVVSGLVRLEELTIVKSFKGWEAEETKLNASLGELDFLSHLTTLRIEISNPNAIPKRKPHWAHKLEKYYLALTDQSYLPMPHPQFPKSILLDQSDFAGTAFGDWFYDDLVRNAQYLRLYRGDCTHVVKRLIRSGYRNLTSFDLFDLKNVKYLSDAIVEGQENDAIFPMLKTLHIAASGSLKEICHGLPPAGSFQALERMELRSLSGLMHLWTFSSEQFCYLSKLKFVSIIDCENLSHLFSLSIAESLSQLEQLRILRCRAMEEIFKKEVPEIEIKRENVKFPKLFELCLEDLPSLRGFSESSDRIEVPALRDLRISDLPNCIKGDNDFQQQFCFEQGICQSSLSSATPWAT